MVQFPLTQHIPNGTTLESSHKKHSFLETQLTHQHMLGSKHDKQLSKEDGTGCRVTSGSKLHIFPLVQPTVNPSEHNTTFTRSQNLQTPVVAFLLYLSQTCSGFGLLVCRCFLVQFGFPQPFLERCYVTHWLLGEMLRSPKYFPCSLNFYITSNCFPPTKWLLLLSS